jgi:hypothetical protein
MTCDELVTELEELKDLARTKIQGPQEKNAWRQEQHPPSSGVELNQIHVRICMEMI